MSQITGLETRDVRFPTSRQLDGSDAMNPNPDYSSAYVVIHTDATDGHEGHGFVFTIGRGNNVELAAIRSLEPLVAGLDVETELSDLGGFSRRLVADSQLRWLGPETGVVHMAIGAVVNAMWDLRAKRVHKPLWRLLCDLSPEELVSVVDFRYLTDALDKDEALEIVTAGAEGAEPRAAQVAIEGHPAYTSSPGWLGYSDERLSELCAEAVRAGFPLVKLKVGADPARDRERCRIARDVVGDRVRIAVDANQVWGVGEAIERINELADFDITWVEEPTSPHDVRGLATVRKSVAPIAIAAGEHVPNRVVFKQMLQEQSIDVMQIDACRVAGVNENIANLLLAAKFGVPVCPHAGGVGLCELVQHLAFFGYVAFGGVSGQRSEDNRFVGGPLIEWIDHLHEHFVNPAVVHAGHYIAPTTAGASTEMLADSMAQFAYPDGSVWSTEFGLTNSETGRPRAAIESEA